MTVEIAVGKRRRGVGAAVIGCKELESLQKGLMSRYYNYGPLASENPEGTIWDMLRYMANWLCPETSSSQEDGRIILRQLKSRRRAAHAIALAARGQNHRTAEFLDRPHRARLLS